MAAITHEINNKLGIIITQCELIKRHSKRDHESLTRLQAIDDAAEAVVRIIRDAAERSVQSTPAKDETLRLAAAGSGAPGLTTGSSADVGGSAFSIAAGMFPMGGANPALRKLRKEISQIPSLTRPILRQRWSLALLSYYP